MADFTLSFSVKGTYTELCKDLMTLQFGEKPEEDTWQQYSNSVAKKIFAERMRGIFQQRAKAQASFPGDFTEPIV